MRQSCEGVRQEMLAEALQGESEGAPARRNVTSKPLRCPLVVANYDASTDRHASPALVLVVLATPS
ncbi:hypothetical protein HEK131_08310 [Streptomyces seoulensis]|nr:hypothetical protein HEK131_08310 [Streptomyces seoulensis]